MQKILTTVLNAGYFDMGQAALKSFMKHNSGWQLHVCDIGLTAEQKNEIQTVGTVTVRDAAQCSRWPNRFAKLLDLAELCKTPDSVILHLDGDTLTFGSIDPLVVEAQKAKAQVVLCSMQSKIGDWLFGYDKMKDLYNKAELWLDHHCYNSGVMLLQASEQMSDIFLRAGEKCKQHTGLYCTGDQEALVAELLDAAIPVMDMPKIYSYNPISTNDGDVALFNPPLLDNGTALVILHIPLDKRLVFGPDASYSALGKWWQQWIARYKEEPWPTQE